MLDPHSRISDFRAAKVKAKLESIVYVVIEMGILTVCICNFSGESGPITWDVQLCGTDYL